MAVAQSEDETPEGTSGSGGEPQQRSANASAASRLAARRAAKAAAKAAKKGTASEIPDEVQARVATAAAAYERNSNKLWLLLGGAVVLVAAGFLLSDVFAARNYEAADALEQGLDAARGAIVKEGEEAPQDDDIETFPSVEARAKKAQEAYASVVQKYGDKVAGHWAKLGEANALAQLGKHAEAQKLFATLTGDADPYIAGRATEGVAFALEAQGKYAEAASQYEALGKINDGELKPLADYHRARMLVAQGKQRDAATVLATLIKGERAKPEASPTRFPNVVGDAETLLTELSVELDDPSLRAELPKARGTGGGSNDLMEQLRMQLGTGEGGSNQLSPELLEMLQKQLGGSQNKTAP